MARNTYWVEVLAMSTAALNKREITILGRPFGLLFGVPLYLNLPGANPHLGMIGNTALLARFEHIRVLEEEREEGAKNVLWLEEKMEAVREEAHERRAAYAKRASVNSGRNLIKPGDFLEGEGRGREGLYIYGWRVTWMD